MKNARRALNALTGDDRLQLIAILGFLIVYASARVLQTLGWSL